MFFSMRVAMCFANFIAPKHVVSCLFDINLYVTYCKLSLRTTSLFVLWMPSLRSQRWSTSHDVAMGQTVQSWAGVIWSPAGRTMMWRPLLLCHVGWHPFVLVQILFSHVLSIDAKCKSLPMSRADMELSYYLGTPQRFLLGDSPLIKTMCCQITMCCQM